MTQKRFWSRKNLTSIFLKLLERSGRNGPVLQLWLCMLLFAAFLSASSDAWPSTRSHVEITIDITILYFNAFELKGGLSKGGGAEVKQGKWTIFENSFEVNRSGGFRRRKTSRWSKVKLYKTWPRKTFWSAARKWNKQNFRKDPFINKALK